MWLTEYRLVLVKWLDSCGAISGWQYLDDGEPELVLCQIALAITYHNLCGYHTSLRATSCMAHGITKTIWSIEDLLTATIQGAYNRRARYL